MKTSPEALVLVLGVLLVVLTADVAVPVGWAALKGCAVVGAMLVRAMDGGAGLATRSAAGVVGQSRAQLTGGGSPGPSRDFCPMTFVTPDA